MSEGAGKPRKLGKTISARSGRKEENWLTIVCLCMENGDEGIERLTCNAAVLFYRAVLRIP